MTDWLTENLWLVALGFVLLLGLFALAVAWDLDRHYKRKVAQVKKMQQAHQKQSYREHLEKWRKDRNVH